MPRRVPLLPPSSNTTCGTVIAVSRHQLELAPLVSSQIIGQSFSGGADYPTYGVSLLVRRLYTRGNSFLGESPRALTWGFQNVATFRLDGMGYD